MQLPLQLLTVHEIEDLEAPFVHAKEQAVAAPHLDPPEVVESLERLRLTPAVGPAAAELSQTRQGCTAGRSGQSLEQLEKVVGQLG